MPTDKSFADYSEEQLEELWKVEGSGVSATNVTRLPLSKICVAPKAFQVRDYALDGQRIAEHVNTLRKGLRRVGKLDPIEAFPIAGKWFALDGHCRLSAYEAEQPNAIVPLTVFKGSFDDALLRSLELNAKDKLPIADETKFNRAWHLVKRFARKGAGSQRGLAEKAGVGKGTIEKMQKALALAKSLTFDVWAEVSWYAVRARVFHGWNPDSKSVDQSSALVKRIGAALKRAVGRKLRQHTAELIEALAVEFPEEIDAIVQERIREAGKVPAGVP